MYLGGLGFEPFRMEDLHKEKELPGAFDASQVSFDMGLPVTQGLQILKYLGLSSPKP